MAAMTRQDMLQIVVLQAKGNGFEFRKWYRTHLDTSWIDFDSAMSTIARGRRYYALLFSHEFAQHFWKPGAQINFLVPSSTYTCRNKAGKLITITRKAFTRRTLKADSWRYHLGKMAISDEPLRYIRRFIVRREDLELYRLEHLADLDFFSGDGTDYSAANPS